MCGRRQKMRRAAFAFVFAISLFWVTAGSQAFDLSHSDLEGHYPWEGISVYEQLAMVSLPKAEFESQLLSLLAQTSFARQMLVPLELRPLTVSMLVGAVIEANFSDEWQVITGDPNPIVSPLLEALYSVILEDPTLAAEVSARLSAIPLMMPDSGGSAVLELKNRLFDRHFLDPGLKYALALPWKVGFWAEGDLIHIDIINPEAIVALFFHDLSPEKQDELEALARQVKLSLQKAIVAALYALFPEEAVSIAPAKLPPYVLEPPGPEERFGIEIGMVEGAASISDFLLKPGQPFNDSLLEVENPLLTMAVSFEALGSREVATVHPFFFQTYAAFDGMASFLTAAYQNRADTSRWIARPDGNVLDDFIFLAAKTYPESPLYDPGELEFYRELLTPIFRMTFLRPRGNTIITFEDSAGRKAYLVEVGSPYFGQILLRLGAHRAPGTPCKLLAYRENDSIKIVAYDTTFMFRHFFGDADPTIVTRWDGAFFWPEGKGLSDLAQEARLLYGAYVAGALERLAETGPYEIRLREEAGLFWETVTQMVR